jgi:hypothetical protein
MYSGKIAVAPGGGGTDNNKITIKINLVHLITYLFIKEIKM